MKSEFGKLINKEFGADFYQKSALYIKKESVTGLSLAAFSQNAVYQELHQMLKDQELVTLNRKRQRIHDVMVAVLQMSRGYAFTLFTYLFCSMVMLILELNVVVTLVAISLLTGLFAYKTRQFLVNKFCYVDAQLVLVYKMVIDQLLMLRVQGEGEQMP